jgi:tetratricopeptide (TPR) repeat protein
MWEDAVSCHQMLEQPEKAKSIVEQLLERSPNSPKLHCILADITGDYHLYSKAWELSNSKFPRAMRSLGSVYYKQKNWNKCIESFELALAINPLFENSWFVIGCAALQIDDYKTAANAFSRCTSINPENAEAWNNLASVYIKMKRLAEAARCLKESIKFSYDSSNIWENYLFVCADSKDFGNAINAMERIFDIRSLKDDTKEKCVDLQILDLLVAAIIANVKDHQDQPGLIF